MKPKVLKNTLIIIAAALIVCILIFKYGGISNEANWNKIYSFFGIKDDSLALSDDYIRFFDVGQGDSALIHSNGFSALIDTATFDYGDDICSKIHSSDIKDIDLLLLTHNHDDHYGGAERITERFEVKNLIIPDIINTENDTSNMRAVRTNVLVEDGEVYTAVQGMHSKIGDFDLTVLAYYNDEEDENNRSIFVMVEIDDLHFLFTGDAEKEAERRLLSENLNIDCDVLKVGHHGSRKSTTGGLLEATTPSYAVISCGDDNQYLHPHKQLLERLDGSNIEVYRTDLSGDIVFNIEDGEIQIVTQK